MHDPLGGFLLAPGPALLFCGADKEIDAAHPGGEGDGQDDAEDKEQLPVQTGGACPRVMAMRGAVHILR